MRDGIPEFGTPRDGEERRDGGCAIVFYPKTQLFAVGQHLDGGYLRLFSGGVEPEEDMQLGTLREVTEESGLCDFDYVELLGDVYAHYYNRLRAVNRVAKVSGYLVLLRSDRTIQTRLESHERFSLTWKSADEILTSWGEHNQDHGLDHWIYFMHTALDSLEKLPRRTPI